MLTFYDPGRSVPVRATQLEPDTVVRYCGRARIVNRRVWTDEGLIFVGFQDGRWVECVPDQLFLRGD